MESQNTYVLNPDAGENIPRDSLIAFVNIAIAVRDSADRLVTTAVKTNDEKVIERLVSPLQS